MDITVSLLVPVLVALLLAVPSTGQDLQLPPSSVSSDWHLIVQPQSLENIIEYVPYDLNLTLYYNGSEALSPDAIFSVSVETTNEKTVALSSSVLRFSASDVAGGVQQNLSVTGQVIGYVHLIFSVEEEGKKGEKGGAMEASGHLQEIHPPYTVTVVRSSNTLNSAFTIIVTVLTMINFVSMGCGLDLKVVKENILRPVGPVVGFISQFTFMPLVSWFINLEKHQLLTIQFQ